MNHPVTVGAQHREVRRYVISDRNTLLQAANRAQVMRFNKAFADLTIAFRKI
jgi:hypothetical protein